MLDHFGDYIAQYFFKAAVIVGSHYNKVRFIFDGVLQNGFKSFTVKTLILILLSPRC